MAPMMPVGPQAGGPPPPPQGMGQTPGMTGNPSPPAPASAPSPGSQGSTQGSAFGANPVGLSGSPDPRAVLQKAMILRNSGAISEQQFQLIMMKLGMAQQSKLSTPPGGPVSTTGVPGAGPPAPTPAPPPGASPGGPAPISGAAGNPSPQWAM